jgi:hypothetical protein
MSIPSDEQNPGSEAVRYLSACLDTGLQKEPVEPEKMQAILGWRKCGTIWGSGEVQENKGRSPVDEIRSNKMPTGCEAN